MADAGAAHGSDLFRIRRIFTLATADDVRAAAPSAAASAGGELPLQIEAMAVHTHEKKQLLAMSIAADSSPNATSAHASAAAAVPSIALGRIPGIEPRKSRLPTGAGGSVADREKKKLTAPVASNSNYLLLRTIEEDQRARFWRFPVATNAKQQSAGKSEKLVALEFSPEGDWLAGLSSRKNRLHLIPVLKLIARQRKKLLDATYDPPYNRELMSVHQSVMNTQMASYLRATNEAGGLNGARYHSQVAGDDEQMSTLEFAVGIGTVTCCRWWRSMNGKNYCLVGGTENLISIVNVEENAEECRCELQNAGTIVSIDLFRENFRKEKRTTMLVKAKGDDRVTRYYRVVLEKKFQQQQRKQQQKQTSLKDFLKPAATPAAATAVDDSSVAATTTAATAEQTTATVASSYVSSSGTQSFTTLPSFTAQSPMTRQTPQYVVKTFPQHFLEDMDFRPQRIKKNSPQVCLYAINGMLTSESSLAMYDPTARRASLYSNFQWSMRNEYIVPSLARSVKKSPQQHGRNLNEDEGGEVDDGDGERAEGVVDVDVSYCTTDLLLLQGKTERSNQNVSTWISLPSHQGLDEDVATAHIVHYLSLHDNEKIERVVQSTSRKHTSNSSTTAVAATTAGGHEPSSEAQVIYILQTQHHVYECRPQWSRLALFKTLCAQSILLRDALSIGYALGIDMASLCQVVAETLCAHIHEGKVASDAQIVQWVRELYEVSRVLPSTAVEQLTSIGGARSAIEYAQQLLSRAAGDAVLAVDPYERKRVALLVLDLVLKEQLRANVSVLDSENDATHQAPSRPRDQEMQDRLAANEKWMLEFLSASVDYDTDAMVDLCLAHQQVDKAVVVGRCRKQVHLVLQKIVCAGLASFVSLKSLRALLAAGFASELSSRANRVILRSFAMEVQVEVLLAYPPAILEQRDWLLRNLASISVDQCRQLAKCVDPRESALATTSPSEETHEQQARQLDDDGSGANTDSVDVASSESMSTTPEEQVELFLTMLLRLNSTDGGAGMRKISFENEDDKGDGEYSQQKLEQLMKELAHRYRPPVMVARCVDYANWNAAASLYEAHGELVEAVESRLHSHKVLRPVSVSSPSSTTSSSSSSSTLSFSALRRRRQSSDASVDSATGSSLGAISDESEFQDAMREELFELLNSLVVQRHKETKTASVFITTTTDEMKAAILARLLVKWFEYGLPKTELEVFLIDPKVYPHVSSLLAKIFFLEVVDGILGGGESVASAIRSSNGSVSSSRGFDDRDKEWVRKCHHLPFSGQFLFHVCVSFLDHGDSDSSGGDDAASSSSAAKGNASYHGSSHSTETRNATQKLLDLVKENVLQNDLSIPVVKIEPHSAQALGKSDPLETHVKVFTCGHVFPKRVFDEEILYEFEKRMNTLPLPLFSTKQVLLKEFKSSAIEAPCPICSFNKISTLVQQHQRLKRSSQRSGASASEHSVVAVVTPRPKQQQPAYYFLHAPQGQQRRNNMHSARGQQQQHQRWQHDEWEWRATA